ncbi:hypothetical protein AAGC94_05065 [Clostridium sporogenes]|uniref:Divalent cation tolerance protein CutA n=1 Tax=Clostridium sporogenes TaxID=1509 RepID=A0A7U4LMJ3_CLOSG|nr:MULTISPECIES: hypothetical protein [Clostridium]AJD32028.1 hypothetical protein T258_427 [Clostridium botulinum Prevot_594]STC77762.1 divalent cations, tolerance CutA family protein [Clostridium botulinum]AKC62382.1 hypothetical protein CLSPO_c16620 [Clostridium sporogenes]EHN16407.1 hypothetical protein IYC_03706 [Clostridium sporogenes PA 3679]KCZ69691.1 hypothetical protein CSPO_4c12160 [Clostridium sporogenes]
MKFDFFKIETFIPEQYKVEFCCTKEVLKNTITAIKKVHPYEIPVINIIPILNLFE